MAHYSGDYSSFVGTKGLPSPANTPYETPGFIRSKRSSRSTAEGSRREQPVSPPPLSPGTTEYQEKSRDGRKSALDPRQFTPTLHASLVSEILNLRRELVAKNHLVENLATSVSNAEAENETLNEQLSQHAEEVPKAKTQVQQIVKGTYHAVEELVKEGVSAQRAPEHLRGKLGVATKKVRQQDEDALRTQCIWESEKESWEHERQQLERRIHVTDNRLRTFVDEMTAQQAALEAQYTRTEKVGDESTIKDSGIGNESDTASVRSATPRKRRRSMSSMSYRTQSIRSCASTRTSAGTPDPHAKPNGHSLADELGIDEEDEYDIDEFEHADDELGYPEVVRRTMESRQGSVAGDIASKAKRVLDLTTEVHHSPTVKETPKHTVDLTAIVESPRLSAAEPPASDSAAQEEPVSSPRVEDVDNGCQPSPPPSPQPRGTLTDPVLVSAIQEPIVKAEASFSEPTRAHAARHALEVATRVAASPIRQPETPVMDGVIWPEKKRMSIPAPAYSTASTQTGFVEPEHPKSARLTRDNLDHSMFVPSIAIHPPSSRSSSPSSRMLPPGTKNSSAQASLPWPSRDASIQTEEIRVHRRLFRLPPHLLPSHLLPSPTLPEPVPRKRTPSGLTTKISTTNLAAQSLPSPPLKSPQESSPVWSGDNSSKDLRSFPLRAIPLPRPMLAPASAQPERLNNGPLNRSSQYGVTRPLQSSNRLADMDRDSDLSDYDDPVSEVKPRDLTWSVPAFRKAPQGRFGLFEPPKVVPEDKETSPERRENNRMLIPMPTCNDVHTTTEFVEPAASRFTSNMSTTATIVTAGLCSPTFSKVPTESTRLSTAAPTAASTARTMAAYRRSSPSPRRSNSDAVSVAPSDISAQWTMSPKERLGFGGKLTKRDHVDVLPWETHEPPTPCLSGGAMKRQSMMSQASREGGKLKRLSVALGRK